MKRAQFAPGIVMTLIAWILLAVVILLLLLLKSNGGNADTKITAIEAASNEAILTAYLRIPVALDGDTVPLAEALVHDALQGSNTLTKTPSEQFMTLLSEKAPEFRRHRITVTLPDGKKWTYGRDFFTGIEVQTKLPMPNAKEILITYTQTNFDVENEATTGIPI